MVTQADSASSILPLELLCSMYYNEDNTCEHNGIFEALVAIGMTSDLERVIFDSGSSKNISGDRRRLIVDLEDSKFPRRS